MQIIALMQIVAFVLQFENAFSRPAAEALEVLKTQSARFDIDAVLSSYFCKPRVVRAGLPKYSRSEVKGSHDAVARDA